jgi:hypothetical protein
MLNHNVFYVRIVLTIDENRIVENIYNYILIIFAKTFDILECFEVTMSKITPIM